MISRGLLAVNVLILAALVVGFVAGGSINGFGLYLGLGALGGYLVARMLEV